MEEVKKQGMESLFCPYEQALALKELGFDEECIATFTDSRLLIHGKQSIDAVKGSGLHNRHLGGSGRIITAPLYQQAFKFFREKYNLQCWPEPTGSDRYSCRYDGNDDIGKRYVGYLRDNLNNILFYKTYEEAELECLIKLIKIVKHEKNSNIKL